MTQTKNLDNPSFCLGAALGKPLAVTVMLLSGASLSSAAQAWGAMAHEIAGELAGAYLTPATRQKINALLDKESLASASTWADRMRSNPSRFWQKEAGPYHYVTVPRGQQYHDIGAPPQGDAVTALTQFAWDLREPSTSQERKRLALRFAVHIIQDLQQPMHVGNGRDRGGNDIEVTIFGKKSNLHRVWDRQIFESRRRNKQQWIQYFTDSPLMRPPSANDADPQLWIAQSAALRESLGPAPSVIDQGYIRRELPRAEQQLALAAIRTAAWLNAIFDADAPARATPAIEQNLETQKTRPWWQRFFKY